MEILRKEKQMQRADISVRHGAMYGKVKKSEREKIDY